MRRFVSLALALTAVHLAALAGAMTIAAASAPPGAARLAAHMCPAFCWTDLEMGTAGYRDLVTAITGVGFPIEEITLPDAEWVHTRVYADAARGAQLATIETDREIVTFILLEIDVCLDTFIAAYGPADRALFSGHTMMYFYRDPGMVLYSDFAPHFQSIRQVHLMRHPAYRETLTTGALPPWNRIIAAPCPAR